MARNKTIKYPYTLARGKFTRELMRTLWSLDSGGRFRFHEIFQGFAEACAIAIANQRTPMPGYEDREHRYKEIVNKFGSQAAKTFSECFALLALALANDEGDVFGDMFMNFNLGSQWSGQFFTPFEVCQLLAKMQLGSGNEVVTARSEGRLITIHDPCIGGGALLLASAKHYRDENADFRDAVWFSGVDVDLKCVHMAYTQLSLLDVMATVWHGNSLSGETWSAWHTPRYCEYLIAQAHRNRNAVPTNLLSLGLPATISLPAAAA